jgi:two-component system, LytTR family, response regulator
MKFNDNHVHDRVSFTFEHNRIGLPTKDGITMVLCKDILRCEADRSQSRFFLISGEELVVKRNIGFYEDKLGEWNFCKVHKSHLVNLQHVEDYVEGAEHYVALSDKTKVPVSVRRRNELVKRIAFSRSFMAFGKRFGVAGY